VPARDSIHNSVVSALRKDGWTITHDPLVVRLGRDLVFIDVAAQSDDGRVVGASRNGERIAVEIKTFSGPSRLEAFERAIGQYVLYNLVLGSKEPGRRLFLAVSEEVARSLFTRPLMELAIREIPLAFVVINTHIEEVVKWIDPSASKP
jgi:hypothetical protein